MSETEDKQPTEGSTDETKDSPNIRRRRALLYGFAIIALILISYLAVKTLTADEATDSAKPTPQLERPLIVERFRLTATQGEKGRGLGELVRRKKGDGLRVLAIELRPSKGEQFYQLLLTDGEKKRVLGNQVVGDEKTFIGEAKITSAALREYKRIELRRVTPGTPPESDLVLRGKIPR